MKRKCKGIKIKPGGILRIFFPEDAKDLADEWLRIFGKDRLGANTKTYMWHVFSAGRYKALSGTEAITQYEQQKAIEYIILSNDLDIAFITDVRPTECSLSDYYVFPKNFAWTMAFTHEDGWLGPYFAYHANYTSLNQSNLVKLQKAHEAEVAKNKGWC